MVRDQRPEAVTGVTEVDGLVGSWVALEPLSPSNRSDVRRLDLIKQRTPNLGGVAVRREASKSFGPAMLIRATATEEALGLVENGEMTGYPGVAVVLIFVDTGRARPGMAMEAFAIYVRNVFASGARLVHIEVIEFNEPVLRMLHRIGVGQQARLRHQMYTGGRFWDVLMFGFDAEQFKAIWSRYARILPGGNRKPAALGSRARPEL
jgi:hypothetical protein